ncbi:MAG: DUF427 domain-containing protein [Candidatus Rokuibacteriota bacterium]
MDRPRAADPQITIAPNPNRVIVRLGGAIIADTTRALVMRAPGTPDQQYIPREDVDMTRLLRTELVTHCPYKGDAAYWSIRSGAQTVENAVWSYEAPYDSMAPIKGRVAFYPDRVDAIEELSPDHPR